MQNKIQIIGERKERNKLDDLIEEANELDLFREAYEKVTGRKKKEIRKQERKETEQEQKQEQDLEGIIKITEELKEIKGFYKLEEGKYEIDFDIYIPPGSKLLIEAGTQLYFSEQGGIVCDGEIEIKGKPGLEVILTALDEIGGWKNLYLRGNAKAFIDYAKFSYGKGREYKRGVISGGAILMEGNVKLKPKTEISNSSFENCSAGHRGGAIYNYRGKLSIKENNRFKENLAKYDGGAICNYRGVLRIDKNNIFKGNRAGKYGGAIYNFEGELNIKENNGFEDNLAKYDDGGAICNSGGEVNIKENNVFEGNLANRGGAIYNSIGKLSIDKNSVFEGNSAREIGGAIWSYGKLNIDKSANVFRNNRPNDIKEWNIEEWKI